MKIVQRCLEIEKYDILILQKSRHFIFLSNSAHWVILIPFSSFYLYRVFLTHIFVLRRSFRVLCNCQDTLQLLVPCSQVLCSCQGTLQLLGYFETIRVLCSCLGTLQLFQYPAAVCRTLQLQSSNSSVWYLQKRSPIVEYLKPDILSGAFVTVSDPHLSQNFP